MRNFIVTIIALLLSVAVSIAQPTFPYNGVKPKDVTSVVFTHATVQVDYQTRIEDATVIIEKGKVVSVGRDLKIPSNAVVMDLMGKYVYPSFIDLHSEYGLASTTPSPGIETRGERRQVADVGDKGALGWNPAIHAEYNAALQFSPKDESAKELRSMGFGAVLTLKQDGIVRGTSALVSLGENANIALIRQDAAAHYSFNKGSSSNAYPSSLMGSIALLRQTYYDANWYRDGGNREERNLSLEAFNRIRSIPQIFDAGEKWNVLRADKVGDEFNVQYIIKTGGNEYQRLAEIKATKAALIVPIVFPDVYDVSDPFLSRLVSLEEMKHWELAPSNCATLAKEQIRFAITSSGFQEKSLFLKNLRKAVKRGLSEQEALKALTLTPAQMINAESELGKIQPGMWANFFIASKNIFEEDAVIYENWVQGKPYVIEVVKSLELAGQYQLKLPKHTYDLNVKEDGGKVKADVKFIQQSKDSLGNARADTISYSVNLVVANELITMTFEAKDSIYNGVIRFSGDVADDRKSWSGKGEDAKGGWFDWTCIRTSDATEKKKESKKDSLNMEVGEIIFPFTAYGNLKLPKQETFLIKNATVWTCDVAGKLEDGSVLIVNGKIAAVGKNIDGSKYPDARVIDAKGKHVTPGIIDEHSHIALASVNEGSQASSAEVQQASVIYPEDINIYRQLSGGVTASQLLHGSANPIGGQSALIKLRWGQNADELLIKGASGFIKFALGENVKQSNWANDGSRFPQT